MLNEVQSDNLRKFRHSLDIQLFAQDPTDPPADPPADPPKPPEKVVFTAEQQAEVDRIASERAQRERKKFADYDDLKTKLSTLETAEAERAKAAMTETERVQAEKDDALKRAQEAEAQRTEALSKADKRVIKSEFKALAREMGVRADALDDAHVLADLTGVSVDDEGNVVGAKEAVEALMAAKPYLAEVAKKEPKSIGNPSNPNPDQAAKTKEQLLKDAADKARTSGRPEDMAAYSALKIELGA
jgi:hypothetical protein